MKRGSDDPVLDKVDPAKRSFVRKVVTGTAFAAPVIASFSMNGLGIGDAKAGETVIISNQF